MNTEWTATKHLNLQDRPVLKDRQDQAVLSISFVLKEICSNLDCKWLILPKIKAGAKYTELECVCMWECEKSFILHPQAPKHTIYV